MVHQVHEPELTDGAKVGGGGGGRLGGCMSSCGDSILSNIGAMSVQNETCGVRALP